MRFPLIWLGSYFFAIAVLVVLDVFFPYAIEPSEGTLNTMFISAGIFALAVTRNDY